MILNVVVTEHCALYELKQISQNMSSKPVGEMP